MHLSCESLSILFDALAFFLRVSVTQELVLGVSSLSRGSVSDKLRWVFTLYDADGDGAISRQELRDVVSAVHRLGVHGNSIFTPRFFEVAATQRHLLSVP